MIGSFLTLGRFYGIDSLMEILIVVVSLTVSLYSHKVYKLLKNKNMKYFSIAFLLIAISLIFKILSNVTLLHQVVIRDLNFVYTITTQLRYMQIINFFSFMIYKTFHVLAFLLIFFIVSKTDTKEKKALFIYFGLIAIFLSIYFNFIFYLTLVFILVFLTMHFYENYKTTGFKNSKLVFLGFLFITISHFILILEQINIYFDLGGEIVMLIGFIFLLINQVKLKEEHKSIKNTIKKAFL